MLRHPHVVDTSGPAPTPALGASFVARTLNDDRSVEAMLCELGVLEPKAAVRVALQAARGINAAHQVESSTEVLPPGSILLETPPERRNRRAVADFATAPRRDAGRRPAGDGLPLPPGRPTTSLPSSSPETRTSTNAGRVGARRRALRDALRQPALRHLEEDADIVLAIVNDEVPHLQDRAPWVSPELALAVHRALAHDAAQRFATLEDFADVLRPSAGTTSS
jgi:hypothetical protein